MKSNTPEHLEEFQFEADRTNYNIDVESLCRIVCNTN